MTDLETLLTFMMVTINSSIGINKRTVLMSRTFSVSLIESARFWVLFSTKAFFSHSCLVKDDVFVLSGGKHPVYTFHWSHRSAAHCAILVGPRRARCVQLFALLCCNFSINVSCIKVGQDLLLLTVIIHGSVLHFFLFTPMKHLQCTQPTPRKDFLPVWPGYYISTPLTYKLFIYLSILIYFC